MKTSKKLVFFGTEDFSSPSLSALIDSGYNVVAVVTKPDARAGRGLRVKQPAVKAIAEANSIPVLQPTQIDELDDFLLSTKPDIGVLVAYGKIIPAKILDKFPAGILNIHPSLLPRYRGPSPIEAVILSGDNKTGVSLMRLEPKMDAGPVYKQTEVNLKGDEDKISLYALLAEKGAKLLIDNLEAVLSGELLPIPQDESKTTYTKLLSKADGWINSTDSAEAIERKVRAFAGYPKTRTMLFDKYEIVINKVRIADDQSDGDLVLPVKNGFIEITELVAPSGRTMSGADFLRGYKV